ncbi:hypothetical protein D3C87_1416920 [compost metagenome]
MVDMEVMLAELVMVEMVVTLAKGAMGMVAMEARADPRGGMVVTVGMVVAREMVEMAAMQVQGEKEV